MSEGAPKDGTSIVGRIRATVAGWPKAPRWGVLLVVLWTVEVFAVQELTLQPMHHQNLRQFLTYRTVRLLLDLGICASLVCALPRAALIGVFAANPFFYVGVLIYHDYFKQPLSALVLIAQGGEGASVTNAFLPLVQGWHAIFLLTFAAKTLLAVKLHPRAPLSERRQPALAMLGGYALLFLIMNPALQQIWKIGTWDSVSGLGAIYGYLPVWGAELAFINDDDVRGRAIERAKAGPDYDQDRLVKIEGAFPVRDRIVFLQVESLDYALVDFKVKGREVTPNLNRLWRESMHYAVLSPKGRGSADADFKALMAQLPSSEVPTFKIPGYPYGGSIVERLNAAGFHTAAVHGVTGEFFNRRPAYEKMSFDELVFREEFESQNLALVDDWAVFDHRVLEVSAKKLSNGAGKQFQIVITATSHIPFIMEESRKVFYPGEDDAKWAYFDSIHYVDQAIGKYVELLPDGTTLVMYGDHVSQMENPEVGYEQKIRGQDGCVPFLVIDVGGSLGGKQQAGDLATSCELTLLQGMRYVHRHVAGGAGSTAKAAPP